MSQTAASKVVVANRDDDQSLRHGQVESVAAGSLFWTPVKTFFNRLWYALWWFITSFVFGGLIVGIAVSLVTTGPSGITDPSTWLITRVIMAYPAASELVVGGVIMLALIASWAHFSSPVGPTRDERKDYLLKAVRQVDPGDFGIRNYVRIPSYVKRAYLRRDNGQLDLEVQRTLRNVATSKQGLGQRGNVGICFYGQSTQGKTRLAWESVRAIFPRWTLVRWPYNTAQRAPRVAVLRHRRMVLWLDDLQNYDPDTVRDLMDLPRQLRRIHAHLVIVATCRDGKDEARITTQMADLVANLHPFRLRDITGEEADELRGQLKQYAPRLPLQPFAGTPGSLIIGIGEIVKVYDDLGADAKRVLKGIKLLRSIDRYEYPQSLVLAAARVFGIQENRWDDAIIALVSGGILKFAGIDGGLVSTGYGTKEALEPVADVYVEDAVYDYPAPGAKIEDQWPQLQVQLGRISDGRSLLALGNAFLHKIEAPKAADAAGHAERAVQCYRAALQVLDRDLDASSWARAQANLGDALFQLSQSEQGATKLASLHSAVAGYRSALGAPLDDYPRVEREDTERKLVAAEAAFSAAGADVQMAIGRYKEQLQALRPQTAPVQWAEVHRSLGEAYVAEAVLGTAPRENLIHAIAAFEQGLSAINPQSARGLWADLQRELGNANRRRADFAQTKVRAEVLDKAKTAYAQALSVYTGESNLTEWAVTQFQLGLLYQRRAKNVEKIDPSAAFGELVEARACMQRVLENLDAGAYFDVCLEADHVQREVEGRMQALGRIVLPNDRVAQH